MAMPRPVGEQERGKGRVADEAAVHATVGQTRDAGRVRQHLPDRVVVAVDVVVERQRRHRCHVGSSMRS